MSKIGSSCAFLIATISLLFLAEPARTQSLQAKPIRIIVPYAPGGSVDLIARILSQQMNFSQPVIIDNRPGAGGALGVGALAKSPPDGHSMVAVGSGAVTVNPLLSKLPYDPLVDLMPVTMLSTLPIVIAVNERLPVQSITELITYAKARPGALSYSSNGLGSISYLAGELFKRTAGVDFVHVPYRGAAPGGAAVATGEVQIGFIDSSGIMVHVRAGKVRALAITDANRSAIVPDLPSVSEVGLPGFEAASWIGLFAPANTPRPILDLLNGEVTRVLRLPDVRERLLAVEMEVAPSTPEEMAQIVRGDLEKWRRLIRETGIKAE